MSQVGNTCVHFCSGLNNIPAAFMCVALFLLQTAVLDYYLVEFISINHLSWIGPDVITLTLLVISIVNSYKALYVKSSRDKNFYSLGWMSWLLMSIVVSAKTIVAFTIFASQLVEEDPSFFGPNTLKTAISLGSGVFFLLLTTQHDAPLGSERKRYIEELTGTVVFDILDTVDILEILFEGDKVSIFWVGLKEFIMAVAALNLIIPTIPLLTLCKTKFGHDVLDKRLIYIHRLLVVLAVNVPNLFVRLILWNVFSGAISPFTLKNIILIAMTIYEFYQHKREKLEDKEREIIEMKNRNENGHGDLKFRLGNSEAEFTSNSNKRKKHSYSGFSIEERVMTDI